jgi:hypothetical protein
MVREFSDNPKRRCQAMIDAGITDPESREGIQFCTGAKDEESRCPYDSCIIAGDGRALTSERAVRKSVLAKELFYKGVSRVDIALMMDTDIKTIGRYLRRHR